MVTTRSPKKAPGFAHHRTGVVAADVLASTSEKHGMNFAGHEWAHFSVRPSGGANPNVAVAAWDGEGWTPIPGSETMGVGVDTAFQFSVRASGRILLCYVTDIAAGSVEVHASGWDEHGGAA